MLGRGVRQRKDGAWRIRPVAPMPENGIRLPATTARSVVDGLRIALMDGRFTD